MATKKEISLDRLETKLDLFKEHFDGHMDVVRSRLDKMDERLDNIDNTSTRQTVTLEEHVKRTNLLEKKIEEERKDIATQLKEEKKELDTKLAPIHLQSTQIKLITKIVVALAAAGGVGGGVIGIKQLISAIFGADGH